MPRPTVLVVEDDPAVRRGVLDALAHAGYEPREASDAAAGRRAALEGAVDLVLLDVVLPLGDGLEILRSVRRERPALPVILMTARGGEEQRVEGLRLGADDYVVKPFSVRELLARVEAVLRRSPERAQGRPRLRWPGSEVDLEARTVRFDDGAETELTPLEASLLAYLASHAPRAVSRDELLTRVWRVNPRFLRTRSVDMAMARLRRKLRDDPPRRLTAVRGAGYRYVEPG